MKKKYELTIGIPSYKNVDTLRRAIYSIKNQSCKDFDIHILISEDDSESHDKIQKLFINNGEFSEEKVKYYYNNPRLGMAKNWNRCLELSDTEYVALLHDDDYLLPDYLYHVKKVLDTKRKWDCVVFSHYLEIDGVRKEECESKIKKYVNSFSYEKARELSSFEYLLGGYNYSTIPTCGILFKRQKFLTSGGYRTEDGYSVDEIFIERFIRQKNIVLQYNVKSGVYTYTTNANLSSSQKIQKCFVTENIAHRTEIAESNKCLKRFILFFNSSMTLFQMGEWQEYLMPELSIHRNMKEKRRLCLFKILCHIYQIVKRMRYRNI